MTPASKVLVLDAMGVIYEVGDDVADLLVPFVLANGSDCTVSEIEAGYIEASLGQIGADELWKRVGVSPAREDEYLAQLSLTDGLREFLSAAHTRFQRVVCLSNDVSRWSRKLRRIHRLESHINGWFISGDLGLRKPDPRIYDRMINELAVAPGEILFVDDRVKNLASAAAVGIQTVHYNYSDNGDSGGHPSIARLAAILEQ